MPSVTLSEDLAQDVLDLLTSVGSRPWKHNYGLGFKQKTHAQTDSIPAALRLVDLIRAAAPQPPASETLDSTPLRFSSMNQQQHASIQEQHLELQRRLERAEAELRSARSVIAALAARPQPTPVDNSPAGKASRLPVPYRPEGGQHYLRISEDLPAFAGSTEGCRLAGIEYTTREAAEASLVRLRQYALLLHLAANNPRHFG
jgi:hypothetical protein